MIRTLFILFLICILQLGISQSDPVFKGLWTGTLHANGMEIDLDIEIDSLQKNALLDVPLQNLTAISSSRVLVVGDTVSLDFPMLRAQYSGVYNSDSSLIIGNWSQGISIPLNLRRTDQKTTFNRPQTPIEPFPYTSTDITIKNNKQNIKLSATLTMPEGKGPFPLAILISGSGPQDRNSEIFKHKPFLIISDYLTREGIAILRYDDRGVGLSKGSFKKATSADLATDAEAVFRYGFTLDNIDKSKIGIIGHSEGGLIAPMIASKSDSVGFIVSIAGPGVPISELMLLQNLNIFKKNGMTKEGLELTSAALPKIYAIATQDKEPKLLYDTLISEIHGFYTSLTKEDQLLLGPNKASYYLVLSQGLFSTWFRYFLGFDPTPYWEKTKCPVLAISGSEDLQVDAEQNITAIQNILKKNNQKNNDFKILKGLNHLMQPCQSCTIGEYATLETTFDTSALKYIKDFIKNL